MKNKIATLAIAGVVALSVIAPAAASMRIQPIEMGVSAGTNAQQGIEKVHYKRYHHRHYKPRRLKHRHYHCHRRLVHGYWKKTCHRARHNAHGHHHGHRYH